jgi:NADH-quinone oxidoreductase subunit E
MSPPGPGERSSPLPLAPALEEYKAGGASLISVLQRAQEIYGWLPQDVLRHISEATGTKFAKIMGVATFYTQFRLQPAGKYVIMLCKGTACHVNGAEGISAAVADELGITEGTTADGLFTLNEVACLGCCSLSPVMMINGETYGSLTPEKARAVLRAVRGTLPEVPSPKEQKP